MAGEETILEVVEEAADTVVRVNVIKSFFSQKSTQVGLVGLVALGLGVATGWKVAEKRLQAKYDIALEEELEKSREFLYRQSLPEDKPEDPETLLASIDDAGVPSEVVGMQVDYHKMFTGQDPNPEPGEDNEFLKGTPAPEIASSETVTVERKLFQEMSEDDLVSHESATQMLIQENLPHVISVDDFNENESEFEQITLTWFAGDGVLVDEQEKMIEDVEGIVGESNMDRFGFLSKDPNLVYIRNPEKELDFEVVHSDGNYAQEVLGFTHSDETFERRQRRSRLGDDG